MNTDAQIYPQANYINNKLVSDGSGEFLTVKHKFTTEEMARLPQATEAQMEAAIEGSEAAFKIMKGWSAGKRSQMLGRLRDALAKEKAAFAKLISDEAGKPIGYATAEVDRCLVTLDTAVREALTFGGEVVPMDFNNGQGKTAITSRFPIGPIAGISPFNFPLNLALHKIAPAFAVGCSIVLKPAPQAPLSALAFAALVKEVGYPAGALSVLVCDIPVAQKLVTDERMEMLSFTGSPQVGWHLKTLVGQKRVALELGGNAAVIVDETADLDAAAKTIAVGAYLYAGQICISTQRIYATETVFETLKDKLLDAISKLQSGDPSDKNTTNGPIIDEGHLNRINDWVQEAVDGGAELLCGGKVAHETGNVYAPTLLTNTKKGMKVLDEEVFGPVAVIEKVADFQEALKAVNDSRFGLQAGVYTNRIDRMKLAHKQLEVGGVMINNVPGFRIDNMPYGGVKDSGLGREGIRYAMEEMTEPRLLVY